MFDLFILLHIYNHKGVCSLCREKSTVKLSHFLDIESTHPGDYKYVIK